MANYICIDGGTTNTRLHLVFNGDILDTVNLSIGARACSEDPEAFKKLLQSAMQQLLQRNRLSQGEICRILASGMITSELGIYTLKHRMIPVDLGILHQSTEEVSLCEISPIPFVFLRGIKKENDMMRGEETELMGLIRLTGKQECTYVLPGSHTKIIATDADGKIIDFSTTLTGEMIAALSQHTILKNSIDLGAPLQAESLMRGYEYCAKEGVNAALFNVRVNNTILGQAAGEVYSFFIGVILHGDVEKILKSNPKKIVLAGKKQIRDALYQIISQTSNAQVVCLSEQEIERSVPLGAIEIYEYTGK